MPKTLQKELFSFKDAIDQLSQRYNRGTIICALAKEIGVSERTFFYYIKNIYNIPAHKYIKLCIILQIAPDEILDLQNYSGDIQNIIDNYLLSLD